MLWPPSRGRSTRTERARGRFARSPRAEMPDAPDADSPALADVAALAGDRAGAPTARAGIRVHVGGGSTTIERAMELPRSADAVIVGGGVVGCSIAYHLTRRGMRNVVVLERETVGSGTTSKAAGGIRGQFPTETEIRFSLEAIRVFERFEDEFGVDPGYKKIGYLFLVSDQKQLRAFEQRIALQTKLGGDVRVITPADAQKLVPALRVDDLIAAVWGPGDGLAGPAEVTAGFARRARELGVKIVEGVRVEALERSNGRLTGVTTSSGAIASPLVINAAGPSAARVARLAGVTLPVQP